jgi:thioredoxin-like negative regulator of GroEL
LNRLTPVSPALGGSAENASRLKTAEQLIEARRYESAHRLCLDVLENASDAGEAFRLLAVIAAEHGNHASAVDLFDRALAGGAGQSRTLALKARSLIALNRRADALVAAEAAAAAHPSDPFTLDTLGVVFSRAGLHERAPPFYAQSAATGGTPGRFYNLGAALQFLGKFDEARAAYRQCLSLDNRHARAWSSLVQITRQTAETNYLAALEQAFTAADGDADARLNLGHALAKAHEDLGDTVTAMIWLERAKAAKRASAPYDPGFDDALFAASARSASLAPADGYRDAQPIFVVGMPRTGTTLVDRILSSHSAVTSAGELTDFALALKRMTRTPSRYVLDAVTLDAASAVDMTELGRRYIASVRDTLNVEGRFIDKMPLNIFLAPLILRALPNARVICLRRHPADTVLSNYRQLFATRFSYYAYAYGLEDTASYYVRFDRLVRQFSQVLPQDRFCEVNYEDIVEDIDRQVRRLLGFCGLDFEPACVNFHENAAPVATASSGQVRQPLYRSALNRWRRAGPALQPALAVLSAAGCLPPDDSEAG